MSSHCRLEAGPFDGDEGYISAAPPELLWAYECPGDHPGEPCYPSGVHWADVDQMSRVLAKAPSVQPSVYRYDRVAAGTMVYVWVGLTLDPSKHEREVVAA